MVHKKGTRDEWLKERLKLLEEEKEHTRKSDELARKRQALPWVKIDKNYQFATDEGKASLKDLFKGRTQLMIYHFMFGPDFSAGCPTCSTIADGFDGVKVHLANHDVMLWAVSRAPLSKLQAYKKRMGWTFPWASSEGGDFNFDFTVSISEEEQRNGTAEYNFRKEKQIDWKGDTGPVSQMAAMSGTVADAYTRERPGLSTFVLDEGDVYHTYSAYARGVEPVWAMYHFLDVAPKGRNETGVWWRRRDEYGK